MIGMTTVFHLLSGVALAALFFGLIRLQKQRDLLRSLVDLKTSHKQKTIMVDWPLKFVSKVAGALNIDFSSDGPLSTAGPSKIKTAALTRLFSSAEVLLISFSKDSRTLSFHVAKEQENTEQLAQQLTKDLAVSCKIVVQ